MSSNRENPPEAPESTSALKQLQAWYVANCNGEWEHSYGVKISTLDNPGWHVEIELAGTPWVHLSIPRRSVDRSDGDWIDFQVSNARFVAYGGASNLEEMLLEFLQLVHGEASPRTTR